MRGLGPFLILTLLLSAVVLPGGFLLAESKQATKDEAQAMATKAANFLQKEGPDKAFAAFNKGDEWRDRDLYVFVIDKTGTWRATPVRPEDIGTKRDRDKPEVQAILAIDKSGWVDYKFKSPADNQEHDKSSYIVRVGDFLVGVGAYEY